MCYVAFGAAFRIHGVGVGQMAVLAWLDQTVLRMTGGAGQCGMNTRVGKQLALLLLMTAQAGGSDIATEGNPKGGMGIAVAKEAFLQGKMFLSTMALTA
jgi:hypothetical protein